MRKRARTDGSGQDRTELNGDGQDRTELNGDGQDRTVPDADALSVAEVWAQAEPDSRLSRGRYAVWKTGDGTLLLVIVADRDDGAEPENAYFPIPPHLVKLAFAAVDGKGPLGHLKRMAERQAARGG